MPQPPLRGGAHRRRAVRPVPHGGDRDCRRWRGGPARLRAGRQHRDAIAKASKPIYTTVNATAAKEALCAFDAAWGHRYQAAIRLWRNAWEEFIPFLDYDTEIRNVICSTNGGITERPLSPRDPRVWPVFHRSGHQMPMLGHPIARPDRDRSEAMDDALEASTERLRHHIRRPPTSQREQLNRRCCLHR
jgi:hypothetical protein